MKLSTIICLLVAVLADFVYADAPKLEASSTVTDYRSLGEVRVWTFELKDTTSGRLASFVSEKTEIDGVAGVVFNETLRLDYNKVGQDLLYEIEGDHYVALDGSYLGDLINLKVNGGENVIDLKRNGEFIRGKIGQPGKEREREFRFDRGGFAADNLFIDQHELYLAMHDLVVGDTLLDTVFVPQIVLTGPIQAVVERFGYERLYNEVFDSVYVIRYLMPFVGTAYFTPDKRLVKMDVPGQRFQAYLDVVRQTQPAVAEATTEKIAPVPASDSGKKMSRMVLYLIISLVAWSFFIGRSYRHPVTFLAFLLGCLAVIVVILIQMPIQDWLFEKILLPRVQAGDSGYLWAILPALAAGLIQELLKVAILIGLLRMAMAKAVKPRHLAAAIGAGFGLVEACYLASFAVSGQVFGWHLLERGFTILYHVTGGALLGYLIAAGTESRGWKICLACLIGFNTILHYLPVFVQNRVVSVEVMYLLMPTTVLGLLFVTLMLFKQGYVLGSNRSD
ncbi:MAG TPA: hypothetical protein PLF13_07160 [candidate division Zixibacteria bacterium]|mgnify:CR=1 FL=1|nr:hypothetical protein [candidate division Zixibacteria bacterium]